MAAGEAPAVPVASKAGDATRARFMAVFDDVVESVMSDVAKSHDLPEEALVYMRRNLNYNVPHGKLNRGMAVSACFAAFKEGAMSAADLYLADVLGWCVELLQAFFLVADDIMDDSLTRRGQPCFYRLPEIGLKAINDSLILELMIYRVLRLKFKDHAAYVALVELFQDITFTTEIGQMLDLTSQTDDGVVDLDRFTPEMLARIYKYKTSHYSFYLPVALGMRLAGVEDASKYVTARRICLEMGHYFQAQDDFLDAFGDPEVTGKVGTDIEENTCTWLIIEALKVASDADKAVLLENYGKKDAGKAAVVKDLYRTLKVPEAFAAYEQSSHDTITAMINEVKDMPKGAFTFLLEKIYKRAK